MENIEYIISRTQGDLYLLAAMQYDIREFSRIYLHSDFCRRAMDAPFSRYQTADADESMDMIVSENPELEKWKISEKDLTREETRKYWWIGFLYRAIAFYSGQGSSWIEEECPFSYMEEKYEKFKDLDTEEAEERIIKERDILAASETMDRIQKNQEIILCKRELVLEETRRLPNGGRTVRYYRYGDFKITSLSAREEGREDPSVSGCNSDYSISFSDDQNGHPHVHIKNVEISYGDREYEKDEREAFWLQMKDLETIIGMIRSGKISCMREESEEDIL